MSDTLPWVEKYRPQVVSDILGHDEAIRTMRCFLQKGELPHILLHGPPGTGKTSLVQVIAKTLYGPHRKHMVLELNASDDRGIAVVRNQIKTFAESRPPLYLYAATPKSGTSRDDENKPIVNNPAQQKDLRSFFAPKPRPTMEMAPTEMAPIETGTHEMGEEPPIRFDNVQISENLKSLKLIVLDEVDQMTGAAQTALRRIMEKYAQNVRFFLMCNDVGRINPPIQSRCTKFRFSPLPSAVIAAKLDLVAQQEGLKVTSEAQSLLMQVAQGDFRRLLNTLQATALAYPNAEIVPEMVNKVLGLPTETAILDLMVALSINSMSQSYQMLRQLCKDGYSLLDIVQAIYKKSLLYEWPNTAALTFYPRVAEIEQSLQAGADERIQMAALVAAFVEVRAEMAPQKFVLKIS